MCIYQIWCLADSKGMRLARELKNMNDDWSFQQYKSQRGHSGWYNDIAMIRNESMTKCTFIRKGVFVGLAFQEWHQLASQLRPYERQGKWSKLNEKPQKHASTMWWRQWKTNLFMRWEMRCPNCWERIGVFLKTTPSRTTLKGGEEKKILHTLFRCLDSHKWEQVTTFWTIRNWPLVFWKSVVWKRRLKTGVPEKCTKSLWSSTILEV